MPKKGDDLGAATAAVSVDHHGVDVVVGGDIFKAVITLGIEIIDPESSMSTYGDIVELQHIDLPSHAHGTTMTVVSTGKDYKLQKTIKDDGYMRTIEITR